VYNSVQAAGGLIGLNVDKSMLQFIGDTKKLWNSNGRLQQRRIRRLLQREEQVRRYSLIEKKKKLVASTAQESHKLDMEIAELEKLKK